MEAADHRGRVMASELRLVVTGARSGQIEDACRFLEHLEQTWSRFIPSSDISRLNSLAGQPVDVAAETLTLIATMIEAWELTGGRYDPGVLPLLVANGYAASRLDATRTTVLPGTASWQPGGILDVVIDHVRSTVTLPVGLAIDPGGIGKGLAADLTVARLRAGGARGALVGIGGDLSIAGEAELGDWIIGVEGVDRDQRVCAIAVSGGGVATSSTTSRRWELNGTTRHHVIDASTGGQSATELAAVTVIADTGWAAEAHATAALTAGRDGVIDYLEMRGLSGLAINADGAVLMTDDLQALGLAVGQVR